MRGLRFVAIVAMAYGCSSSTLSQLEAITPEIASVDFRTTSEFPSNMIPTGHVTVDDATRAQALYRATIALPATSGSGTTDGCDGDGVVFHMVFYDAGHDVVATAALAPAGACTETEITTPSGLSLITLTVGGSGDYFGVMETSLQVTSSQISAWGG